MLPKFDNCPKIHLQAVMQERKQLLHKDDAKPPLEIPAYDELNTKRLVDVLKQTKGWNYHPDENWTKRAPDRDFVVQLLSTFAREYTEEIVKHAHELRDGAPKQGIDFDDIGATPRMLALVNSAVYRSKVSTYVLFNFLSSFRNPDVCNLCSSSESSRRLLVVR